MTDFDNGRADDQEQYEARHRLSRRERLARDPDYGDYMYEQARDRELEKEVDKEGKSNE